LAAGLALAFFAAAIRGAFLAEDFLGAAFLLEGFLPALFLRAILALGAFFGAFFLPLAILPFFLDALDFFADFLVAMRVPR
jgi:hypothetical protein